MSIRRNGTWAAIGATLLVGAHPGLAQDFVGQANDLYSDIRPSNRSDRVLLPLLAEMEPPPGVVATPEQAMLFPDGAPGWDAVEAWTQAAPQQAVLEGLATVTADKDARRGMAFGQPYGQAAGYEAISTGLYTDLGDPPLLAAAQHLYLPALDDMACLVHAEVTRRAGNGAPLDGATLLLDWIFFARQMADREMFDEARWGYVAQASVGIPIFGGDHGLPDLTRARRSAAEARARALERRVAMDVTVAHRSLVAARQELARFRDAMAPRLELLTRGAESGYREGTRTIVELLDARRAAAAARRRMLALEQDAKRAEVRLRGAVGAWQ